MVTAIELRCDPPDGIWRTGHTPGPLTNKQTSLFMRSVIGYLHHSRQSTAEECHTDGALGPQVLLLPTGKPVRESPEMKAQEEARHMRAVERTAAFRQASRLEDTQGEVRVRVHLQSTAKRCPISQVDQRPCKSVQHITRRWSLRHRTTQIAQYSLMVTGQM